MSFAVEYQVDSMEKLFSYEFEQLAPELLDDVAPDLVDCTKNALRSVVRHPGDSEMVNSVKHNKPKLTKTDACIVNAYPTGYSKNTFNRGKRKYPVTNAAKAIWLEYGVAGKQAPRPWRDKAVKSKESEIQDKMQKKYNEMVGAE